MIRSVEFLSEKAVIAMAPRPDTAIVSITNPGVIDVPLRAGWGKVKRCYFPDAGCDDRLIAFLGGYEKYLELGFFNHTHAQEILAFVNELASEPHPVDLIIHCHAGKSRSAAVAKYVAEEYALPFDQTYDRYNQTVYELLQNPYRYAPPDYQSRDKPARSSLWDSVMRIIGLE